MIRLDTIHRSLQLVLDSATTTNALSVVVCYSDKLGNTYNGSTQLSNSNGTTQVTIGSSPAANTNRDVDSISIFNTDTASATINISYNDNGTLYLLRTQHVNPGENLLYTHGNGWNIISASGISGSNVTKTSAYTITNSDYTISCDLTSSAFTITLPSIPKAGSIFIIKKIDSSGNSLTIDGNTRTIDGASSFIISSQWNFVSLMYNATLNVWQVLSSSIMPVNQVSNNASYYPALVNSTTSSGVLDVNAGLSFNPSTNNLTTTTFTGALVGNANTSTTASGVTVNLVSDNVSYYPTLVNSTTGNLALDVGSGLTFDPSTNTLSTNIFSGNLNGTASVANSIIVNPSVVNAVFYPIFTSGTTGIITTNIGTGLSFNPGTNALTTTSFIGALTGNADSATTTAITSITTNASYYPTFVSTTTGNIAHNVGTGLTFNPSTNALTTTSFIGALTGNATTSTNSSGLTSATTNVNVSASTAPTTGQVLTATSGTAATWQTPTSGGTITISTVSNNATYYPTFVSTSSGTMAIADVSTGLSFNPSTNNLITTTFTGALVGNADSATTATTRSLLDSSTFIANTQFVNNAMQLAQSTIPLSNITGGTYSFASLGSLGTVTYVATAGVVTSLTSFDVPGTGYIVGDILTIGSGNGDCCIAVASLSGSGILTGTILYGGTGYTSGTSISLIDTRSIPSSITLNGTLTSDATFLVTNGTYLTQSNQWNIANNTTSTGKANPTATFIGSTIGGLVHTSSTFNGTSINIGTAFGSRRVIIFCGTTIPTNTSVISASIGGISATIHFDKLSSNGSWLSCMSAVVPTGTTANIVINMSGLLIADGTLNVYTTDDLLNDGVPFVSLADTNSIPRNYLSASISETQNGFALAGISWTNNSVKSTEAISGFTTDVVNDVLMSGTLNGITTTNSMGLVSASWNGNYDAIIGVISFTPSTNYTVKFKLSNGSNSPIGNGVIIPKTVYNSSNIEIETDGANDIWAAGAKANSLNTSSLPVDISSAAPPTIGQMLTATSPTTASWQNTMMMVVKSAHINLGINPITSGNFQITGTGFVMGKGVVVTQSCGPYINKGSIPDEVEMDQITISSYVLNPTTIQCYWGSGLNYVSGYYKFDYWQSN